MPRQKKPAFSIREGNEEDLEGIEELVAAFFPRAKFQDLPDDRYFVAEHGGKIVGFCHFRIREKTSYVAGLGVIEMYRRIGIGGALLSRALDEIDRSGITTTYLKVHALNRASNLYSSLGFFEKKMGDVMVLERKRTN